MHIMSCDHHCLAGELLVGWGDTPRVWDTCTGHQLVCCRPGLHKGAKRQGAQLRETGKRAKDTSHSDGTAVFTAATARFCDADGGWCLATLDAPQPQASGLGQIAGFSGFEVELSEGTVRRWRVERVVHGH